jgi:hypothetical protein
MFPKILKGFCSIIAILVTLSVIIIGTSLWHLHCRYRECLSVKHPFTKTTYYLRHYNNTNLVFSSDDEKQYIVYRDYVQDNLEIDKYCWLNNAQILAIYTKQGFIITIDLQQLTIKAIYHKKK